ncbi:MAG: STAS domain-containing protein [Spirochaetes bacterium]|nr:STAS domain-containing protein [Spirochaetota bacterium]
MIKKSSKNSSIFKSHIRNRVLFVEFKETRGSIDIKNVNKFSDVVNDGIKQGIDSVRLDCGNLDFIDTSGLGKLLAFSKRMEVILVNVNPKIKKIMDITKLSTFFKFE